VIADGAASHEVEWRAARHEAVAALTEALRWELPQWRWENVQAVLAELAGADSPDRLWQATASLELCGPLRVARRLGDAPEPDDIQLPAPKAVRERIAELIDTLAPGGHARAGDEPGPGSQGTVATAR
jgi:hypothetical protein